MAVVVLVWALAVDPWATVLTLVAVGGWAWAIRETQRFIIAPRDQTDLVGLSELAPLIEALPDPALLVDDHLRIVCSNASARRQMQFQARGQFLTSVLRHPDVLEAAQRAIRSGEACAVEFGTPAPVERRTLCHVAPLTWSGDRAAVLVFHDQTARISTERLRADFLANASHELRTPLASMTLLMETVLGPARDNAADRDRFLGMMQVQAERMRRLIDDLLSLSRIELDEHIPPSDRADLAAVVRETIDAMVSLRDPRAPRIELRAPAGPVMVIGERFQLAQVVQNLVDNAVKYSPAGSAVVVEVGVGGDRDETAAHASRRWAEARRVAPITPTAAANRSYAYVRVEDRGAGIAERFLPRLGERFFRVERELGDEKGGTGLGLAIVKHIVNRHRGGFTVESQEGFGSAFAAYVPLAEDL
ncbi:MAG: PAS domain-containing protein [Hyphomonadaceae bacterium]|nr:PAS domain-containing protein [Hyphomonadaceae bacterium]